MKASDSSDQNEFEVLISEKDVKAISRQNLVLKQTLETLKISSSLQEAQLTQKIREIEKSYNNYRQQSIKVQTECIQSIKKIFQLGLDEKKNKYEMIDQRNQINKIDELLQQLNSIQQQNSNLKEHVKNLETKIVKMEANAQQIVNKQLFPSEKDKNSYTTHGKSEFILEKQNTEMKKKLDQQNLLIDKLQRSIKEIELNNLNYIKSLEKIIKQKEQKLKKFSKTSNSQKIVQNGDKDLIISQMKEQIKSQIQSKAIFLQKLSVKEEEVRQLKVGLKKQKDLVAQLKKEMMETKGMKFLNFDKVISIIEEYLLKEYLDNIERVKGEESKIKRMHQETIEKLIQEIKKLRFE